MLHRCEHWSAKHSQTYVWLFTVPTVPQSIGKVLAMSPYNTEEQRKEKFVTCQGSVVVMTLSVVHWRAADIPGRNCSCRADMPVGKISASFGAYSTHILGRKTLERGFTISKG